MNLLFFGADDTWVKIQKTGFKRRNTWILKTFAEAEYFDNIYIVRFTSRKKILKRLFEKRQDNKVKDIFIANFFPLKLESKFAKTINHYLFILQFFFQKAQKFNRKNNILWAYWSSGFLDLENLNFNGRCFFDTDHNIIDDINLPKNYKQKQEKILIRAGKKSEKVISSSRSMLNWYTEKGFPNLYRMRNGVCLDRFVGIKQSGNTIIIGYVGTLSKWIDYSILEKIVRKNTNCEFHIYGKNYKTDTIKILEKYDNVFLKGELSAGDFPKVVKNFNIALNIYQKQKWLDVDSMKIFEYIASDVPVVSTKFHDFLKEDFDNILFVGNNFEELQKHIDTILSNDFFNKKHISFLKKHTWKKQIDKFMREITNAR